GASRLGVETRYVCWGAGIVDLDNDGLPDLFMVTGHVYPQVERTLPQYPHKTPRALFRNLGKGVFEELTEEAGPGVAAAHCSRGCALDRKSTRLNSSHVAISYAVFCLKKKKT